ncbi:MAG: hypothetical protein JO053_06795 [Acidobacteria bacterium]|nr:hypothetical protein [Acidobacteriota bacterium]
MKIIVGLLMIASLGVAAWAQQDAKVVAEMAASTDRIVKNSPFSADAISESVQTLADGNRIVHTTTTKMFRNSEGRFRRDISSGSGSVPGANYNVGFSTTILDPVNGARYTFNDREKVARQYTFRAPTPVTIGGQGFGTFYSTGSVNQADKERSIVSLNTKLDGSSASDNANADRERAVAALKASSVVTNLDPDKAAEIEMAAATLRMVTPAAPLAGISGNMTVMPSTVVAPVAVGGAGGVSFMTSDGVKSRYESHTEKLGTQNFEGVDAEGTRTTTTIPAGAIGNERPIDIVYESWYSKDLQLVVYSKRSDPRTGEQTYRLTNISRSEPDQSVFAVPSGYRIVSQNTPGVYTVATPKKTATPQTEAKAAQQPTPGTTRARP